MTGNPLNVVDRLPFFVSHNQHLVGNIADLTWDSSFLGMDNRFAAELAASHNKIVFSESSNSTSDTVNLVDPARGYYGPLVTLTRTSVLDTVSQSFEDRLKITPTVALIGGVRIDELNASKDGQDFDRGAVAGLPLFGKLHSGVVPRRRYLAAHSQHDDLWALRDVI